MAAAGCTLYRSALAPLPPEAPAGFTSGGYRALYSFGRNGKSGDGNRPVAPLVAVGERLYGTTQYGGVTNGHCKLGCGVVFAVTKSGSESVLYRFKGGSDGAQPLGELANVNGKLIGTTSAGGASGCGAGCGTIFALSTDANSETTLYRFKGGSDGAAPAAGLIAAGAMLYGTTQHGGMKTPRCPHGCGTIFSVSENGTERVVYRFKGSKDGAYPVARLIVDNAMLYGTTQYGGPQTPFCAAGCGTLFQMTAAGAKKILHGFSYGPKSEDGAYPGAGVIEFDGKLYGTTMGGGRDGDGAVFEADASSGSERVLHSFSCCGTRTDGTFPFARLVRIGNLLFGTTRDGGTSNAGTIFSIRPSGSETVVHDFGGKPDGALAEAGLIVVGRALFGTASSGGARSQGMVFEQKE
jgi:uncharacterized repeat protein (TIGR03803 family)